jgi:hypothetical protein
MKIHHFFYYLAVVAILFAACKKTNNETTESGAGSITYPATGKYGDNILSEQVTVVYPNTEYSMKAEVPAHARLKIILRDWLWGFDISTLNWSFTEYDFSTDSQEFMVTVSGKPADMEIEFMTKGQPPITDETYITVEYYENNDATPTKVKKLQLKPDKKL